MKNNDNLIFSQFIKKNEKVRNAYTNKIERFNADIYLYDGKLINNNDIIEKFPLNYKVDERLKEIKKLMFFLSLSSNIDAVKKNNYIYFTKRTFDLAGIDNVSPMKQHRLIEGLKNVGVLKTLDDKYQFGTERSFCKRYFFNSIGIIRSFTSEYLSYVEQYNKKKAENNLDISDYVSVTSEKTSSQQLAQDKEIIKKRLNKFSKGSIDDFIEKLNEYNEGLSDYNKKVLKIKYEDGNFSCRSYSHYIATTNKRYISERSKHITDRSLWLEREGLKYSYDIKSAVPRVSHLVSFGEWKPSSFDFYVEIPKAVGGELSRQQTKDLHMRLRFGKNAKVSFNHWLYSLEANKITEQHFVRDTKPVLQRVWEKYYNAVEALEGKDHSSSIFYFESYLELCVVWRLKKMGITAYNIYDEFFYDKPCDIEKVIEEEAQYVYKMISEC